MQADYAVQQINPGELPVMKALLRMFGEVFDEPDTYTGKLPPPGALMWCLYKPTPDRRMPPPSPFTTDWVSARKIDTE